MVQAPNVVIFGFVILYVIFLFYNIRREPLFSTSHFGLTCQHTVTAHLSKIFIKHFLIWIAMFRLSSLTKTFFSLKVNILVKIKNMPMFPTSCDGKKKKTWKFPSIFSSSRTFQSPNSQSMIFSPTISPVFHPRSSPIMLRVGSAKMPPMI